MQKQVDDGKVEIRKCGKGTNLVQLADVLTKQLYPRPLAEACQSLGLGPDEQHTQQEEQNS